jgi:adenosylcobinamide-GDP ribazoletransferase
MLPFWIALQFLSSLPVRLAGMPGPAALGRSLLWYPAVGLLFGVILAGLQWLLGAVAPMLQAALLLGAWVLLSGALHLDGLADSADAWLGGFGDRARTLDIMKDPRSGPLAVVTLIVVLLLKFSALLVLVERGQGALLVAVPVIGRAAVLGLFLSTPYGAGRSPAPASGALGRRADSVGVMGWLRRSLAVDAGHGGGGVL